MVRVKPEDLLNSVVLADDLRRRSRRWESTRAARWLKMRRVSFTHTWVEPFFNVWGILWGLGMAWTPWPFRRRIIQWLNIKMGGHPPENNPDLADRIRVALSQAQELKNRTGQWPAVLVLTSHPDTEGPLQWLRFEVFRQGLELCDALVSAQRRNVFHQHHPKALGAIDPFALDTVSPPVAGVYAGALHRLYLAWDRQTSIQPWIQRAILLRNSGLSRILWRLLKTLREDIPVLMVLAGGLPFNARLLYGAREFVQRMPIRKWKMTKRQAQKELMDVLMRPEGDSWPAEEGELTSAQREAVVRLWRNWGLDPGDEASTLRTFLEEFRPAVPFRARLFRILVRRLVARGKPLMMVPVAHRPTPPHVRVGSPLFVTEVPDDIDAFAKHFVLSNF